MERLTQRVGNEIYVECGDKVDITEKGIIDLLKTKLAAYEDTGLEPAGIKADSIIVGLKELLAEIDERNHVTELLQAESEGRLIVLPCKVGENLFYNFLGKTYEGKLAKVVYHEAGVQVYFSDYDGDNASRRLNEVFKTREEAKKALEGMKNG